MENVAVMTDRPTNPMLSITALDFKVYQALREASSPPFLGLLEFSDVDRETARNSIIELGKGDEANIESVLRKHQNFAAWYLCDVVRRTYGSDSTPRVWPDIANALGIQSDLNHPFRYALHEIVANRCEKLGLPVPPENRVSLFRLHAGVSESQLPALVRAFMAQERSLGLPLIDDGNALNEWEDNSLLFVPDGLKVLRMPILWDVSAWHAAIFVDCREGNVEIGSVYHQKFSEIIEMVVKERTSFGARVEVQARPRLVLENMEIALNLPDGTSRHIVKFDDEPLLRVRPGTILPLPYPLPRKVGFGPEVGDIELLSMSGDVLVGDGDLGGNIVSVRRKATLSMSNVVLFAREAIVPNSGEPLDCYEIAEGLFTAAFSLPQSESLELLVGKAHITLARQPYRRVSLRGGIIGRGPSGALYGPDATLLVRTGIATATERDLTIRLGEKSACIVNVLTDAAGDADIPISEIISKTGLLPMQGPTTLRIEIMRPRDEDESSSLVGSGVRMRADYWPSFIGRYGAELRCDEPPENLILEESRNISLDRRRKPCVDTDATSETEIVFKIEGKHRRYRLPPLGLSLTHILPDGASRPLPLGSSLVLSSKTRGGAVRVKSNDFEASLDIPGRTNFTPFRGGRTSTVSLRGVGSGWLKLHKLDGISLDLVEFREEFAYRSVKIERRGNDLQIRLSLDGEFDAVRAELEMEMGQSEVGDIYFGIDKFVYRQPEWISATRGADGILQIDINGQSLESGIWLGRLYVRDGSSWHPMVSPDGNRLTFIVAKDPSEPEEIFTLKRLTRVIGWLDIGHATESWKEGAVGTTLRRRLAALINKLNTQPGGRARILALSLSDDWFVTGSTWMPPMHALLECPEMFESPVAHFHSAGGAFEPLSLIVSRRLRELEELDQIALMGFANAAQSQSTDEKLIGFDVNRLMMIVSSQEGLALARWNNKPILGPTHWRAAHLLLQDRIDETEFFGDDMEGNTANRRLNLRRLHGSITNQEPGLPVPSFLPETSHMIHRDFSRSLRSFAVAARSCETKAWLSRLVSQSDLSEQMLISALGDLIRLAPELFAFHILAAEFERRES